MYDKILVSLDGSALAEQILPYVRPLAKALVASIELLRTIPPSGLELADPAYGRYPHQIDANLQGQALDYLRSISASLNGLGVSISYIVRQGDPASWITSEAEKEPGTLIAISTHGRSGVARWLLGSVTDKVLQATTTPLLIVRSSEPPNPVSEVQLKTVIVPLDGSVLAEQVLPHIATLAKALGLEVKLVRVHPSVEEYSRYFERQQVGSAATVYSGPYEVFSREADAQAMEYLHEVKMQLHRQGVWSVEESLLRGHPAATIVDLASEIPGSLVAISTHGRSGIGRWLLGSVTDRVVRHSPAPVLVIRPEEELTK
ncbi:MAG TPA: universal stress protein [Dehalococcoidia bacterium]|jgi:nucleotide-binding universal stress UspA family protein|nr:universal stress protein [Dehalococcoidia bacterium]